MNSATRSIKYRLADHMRNSMHMPTEMLEHLEVYKMIHMVVPEFKNSLLDGQIKYSWLDLRQLIVSDMYNVIYHQCPPAAAKSAKEIRLSFRKAKQEFEIEPYVLVQIVQQQ